MRHLWGVVQKQWFVLALLTTMLVAIQWPPSTITSPLWDWLSYAAISIVFLASGLSLRSGALASALGHWRVHLSIQALSFLITPLIAWGAASSLLSAGYIHPALATGIIVCGALPTTIVYCVAINRAVGANTSAALVNATAGNLLGVLITPLWVLGASGPVESSALLAAVLRLLPLVAVPLLIGQVLRLCWAAWAERHPRLLGQGPLALILVIIFVAMARAAQADALPSGVLAIAVLAGMLVLHGVFLLLSAGLAALPPLGLSPADRATITICGSQKTLALGVPLIALCFPGHPHLAMIMLPMICYHPLQLITAALMVPWWRGWLQRQQAPVGSPTSSPY
ncbi:MAG: hypothetical protein EA401_00760 [Planctomycetota bacterium]|nr:MAG: hypothetical protein EA401_00760 [Planctomycetota bacterium]